MTPVRLVGNRPAWIYTFVDGVPHLSFWPSACCDCFWRTHAVDDCDAPSRIWIPNGGAL